MSHASARARLTIGVILDNLTGESRSSLWPGIADTIQARDGNLLCFTGGYLHDPHDFTRRGNIIYEMIDKEGLDGLIIWASSLSSYVGRESIRRFCDRYRPLPIVSIGMVLENIPSVVLDSHQGMYEALVHLVTAHGRRRLVFIRGPEGHRDAEERYRAYLDALKEYDIPFAPELVSPHYKWYEPGETAMMRLLLDERRVDFDAVAAAHDGAAVEAMEFLQARGIRVPEDVSVVGFNDVPLSRVVTPSLTTEPWRMYERGQQAAQLLLAMLAGESVPDQVLLPTHLIVRQSCGCLDPAVVQAKAEATASGGAQGAASPASAVARRECCLTALEQVVEEKSEALERLARFLDAFLDELEGGAADVFLPTLDRILRQVVASGGDISAWQAAVSALRRQILPTILNDPRALARAEQLVELHGGALGVQSSGVEHAGSTFSFTLPISCEDAAEKATREICIPAWRRPTRPIAACCRRRTDAKPWKSCVRNVPR